MKKGRVTIMGYVSKEDLCGALTVLLNLYKRNQRPGWGAIEGLIDLIEQTPDAEVAPVKRGRWENTKHWSIEYHGYLRRCSACEKVTSEQFNFCPNCGADMRKEG